MHHIRLSLYSKSTFRRGSYSAISIHPFSYHTRPLQRCFGKSSCLQSCSTWALSSFAYNLQLYIATLSDVPKQQTPIDPSISPAFAYEQFYRSVIQRKKEDKSYRYFRNVNRIAKEFPLAHADQGDKRINVWCTNDYVSPFTNILH